MNHESIIACISSFVRTNYTLRMQILSLLTALTISVILASQTVSTWSTPRDASIANQDVAVLRSAIREHMAYAVTHQ
ncbi:MAG: hypothetical protein EVA60_02950 [Litorivicinaceae bacterium]|nr:MAG: hypothetical protein EVA60_02950 [Litorivicinaceae bacterium]